MSQSESYDTEILNNFKFYLRSQEVKMIEQLSTFPKKIIFIIIKREQKVKNHNSISYQHFYQNEKVPLESSQLKLILH